MKITNHYNLPEPLVRVIEKISNQYDKGLSDITATGLLKPIQMVHLEGLYKDQLQQDVTDMIYSAVGTSIHSMLEEAGKELRSQGYIVEERFYFEVNGWKVGAKVDLYDPSTGTLWDYKNTSVYSVKGELKEDYAKQLNIGAEALRQNGHVVNKLKIAAIIRDWRKGEYQRDEWGNYPEKQYKELDVFMISSAEVMSYVLERVKGFQAVKEGVVPECTPEERWASPDKWAVMRKGRKSAIKLCDTETQAISMVESLGKDHYTQFRGGESRRCKDYCSVSKWCPQYNNKPKGTKNE